MGFFEVSRPARRRMEIAAGLPTGHPGEFDALVAMIRRLPDPQDMCAEERAGVMTAVQVARNALDAYLSDVVAAAEEGRDSRLLHAGTTGMLVAAATGQTPAAGSGIAATARALADMPRTHEAYRSGEIGTAAVMALARSRAHLPSFASLEESLVEIAAATDAAEVRNLLAVLIAQDRPSSADDQLERQREKRGVTLTEQANGLFRLEGYLDGVEGRRLRDAMAQFSDRPAPGDGRTRAQRNADALGDLVAAGVVGTRPLGVSGLTVLVDVEHVEDGEGAVFQDSTPIGPAEFERLICTAVCAIVLGTRQRRTFVPLAMGRTARRATPGQWIALIARDRGCIRCGRSPNHCEAHHVVHWRDGGVTDLSNLVLLCSRCHHDLHHGRYVVTMDDGVPVIRPSRSPPIRAG